MYICSLPILTECIWRFIPNRFALTNAFEILTVVPFLFKFVVAMDSSADKVDEDLLPQVSINVTYLSDNSYSVTYDTVTYNISFVHEDNGNADNAGGLDLDYRCVINDNNSARATLVSTRNGSEMHLFAYDKSYWCFALPTPKWVRVGGNVMSAASGPSAPMPGVIEKIFVSPGQKVKQNDPLVVMMAMKMEYVIRASQDGEIEKVLCTVGLNVGKNAPLVKFKEEQQSQQDSTVDAEN